EIAAFPWKTYLTNWSPVRPKNRPRRLASNTSRVARGDSGGLSTVADMRGGCTSIVSAPTAGQPRQVTVRLQKRPPAVRAWAAGGRLHQYRRFSSELADRDKADLADNF